jgi:hypothetical protein
MPDETPRFAVTASRQFPSWLASAGVSLAVTTYQSGKMLLFGTKAAGGLAVFERSLDRPMGLAVSGPRLAVATLTQIVTFVDFAGESGPAAAAGGGPNGGGPTGVAPTGVPPTGGFDAVFIP